MNAALSNRLTDVSRERAVILFFGAIAFGAGLFVALGTESWIATLGIVLVFVVIALTLPLRFVALAFAALMPFQFYFQIPGSTITLRGSLVVLFIAVARVLLLRVTTKRLTRLPVWMLPAGAFLLAALAAAFGALDRYAALKGIFDWLIVFATVIVIGEIVRSDASRKQVAIVLIVGGVVQGILGLLEYVLQSDAILRLLQTSAAEYFMQPNLLKERLADLSFNWYTVDRITPFGTFINAIDYSVFLAAILALVLVLLERRSRAQTIALVASALVIAAALLLSFKTSGLLAALGGIATIALLQGLRSPSRTIAFVVLVFIVGAVIALPFADLLVQRVTFVVERELGLGGLGRLEIWTSLAQYFGNRPIFGYGLNNSILLTDPSRTLVGGASALNPTASENAYLALLIETGAVGLLAFLSLVALALTRSYQHARIDSSLSIGVCAAIVALLVGNFTVTGFTTDQNGMLLGILLGMVFVPSMSLRGAS
jgi:O-antigen ligase